MDNYSKTDYKSIAAASIICALNIVIMYLGSIVEVLDLTAMAITSLFSIYAILELPKRFPFLVYFVTSVLAILMLPDKFLAVMYILMGGIYPIIKVNVQRLKKILSWMLKIVYFNIVMIVIYFFFKALFFSGEAKTWMLAAYACAGNVAFVLYDLAIEKLTILYLIKYQKILGLNKKNK